MNFFGKRPLIVYALLCLFISCKNNEKPVSTVKEEMTAATYKEAYRPQFHFSPPQNWMNDPNGLVYHQGIYHLFYQYYPEDSKWGPMHWGHATSEDLVHWEQKPIALFPDEHGYIFSGSAVVDSANSAGFGTIENPPLVAIFTYHDPDGEKAKKKDFQTQGIAYSLDNGDTWVKYEGNPVIGNEGIKDFRDPKVFWYEQDQKWVMALVAGDHLQLWGSADLKSWEKLSEFGHKKGAHGGVWECPDLFKLKVTGSELEKWVLLISINPGAPNGGSGTQYFVGDFDGQRFTTDQEDAKWIDYGTDNYAGVTYNNIPDGERIFIGWMSNWNYAQATPTETWRSAMTLPRTLSLQKIGTGYTLFNYPVAQLNQLVGASEKKDKTLEIGAKDTIPFDHLNQAEIKFKTTSKDFVLSLKNTKGEELVLTITSDQKLFLLDRIVSGKTDFKETFANTIQQMPVDQLPEGEYEVRALIDRSSVEVFLNKGQYVMTAQVFPNEHYQLLEIENTGAAALEITKLTVNAVSKIW